MSSWHDSRYTGLFSRFGALEPRPHDPDVFIFSAELPPMGPRREAFEVGGAGWDEGSARAACLGEGIERMQSYPLPRDRAIEASVEDWPLDEAPVGPDRWVLFHPEQHREPGFPFQPFTGSSRVRWTPFRDWATGEARWVPEEFAHLQGPGPGPHRICPATSTGLAAGRPGMPVLLRGLQEAVERDAALGGWWGRYPLEHWDEEAVWAGLGPDLRRRLVRPNLRYRFWRVRSPLSDHVTWVTLEGEDLGGYVFAAGQACRESRNESWRKALLEAVHGFRYVGHLRRILPAERIESLSGFAHHAAYYSLHPELLETTVLARSIPPAGGPERPEGVPELAARLGPDRPVLFRNVTPPEVDDWLVLRVLVPGLQPLHGADALAHLGGPLWAPRGLAPWRSMPAHPFP
jgi:thiazole/oxazole-forming peptide maturase SagD family component